jgi:curved DNA-binding protein CbpA
LSGWFDLFNSRGNLEHEYLSGRRRRCLDVLVGIGIRGQKMTPYDILQVSHSAPQEVIRAAWSALIRQCHPDSPHADEKRTRHLNEAYAILKDPKKRAALDAHIKARAQSGRERVRQAARSTAPDPHSAEMAYPQAYEGFSPERIDEAIEELTRAAGAPPIVGEFMQFLHQQARKKK